MSTQSTDPIGDLNNLGLEIDRLDEEAMTINREANAAIAAIERDCQQRTSAIKSKIASLKKQQRGIMYHLQQQRDDAQ